MSVVSVVIPCLNAGRYIGETLESIRRQSLLPFEVIVADDGSVDDSVTIARNFGAKVVAVSGAVHGASAARNTGIKEARGAIIALLDADDIWLPDHLATLCDLLTQHPSAGVAFSRVELFGDKQWIQEEWVPAGVPVDGYWACVGRTVVYPSGAAIRREVFDSVGGFDESIRGVEDFEFFQRVSNSFPIVCAPQISVMYRKYAAQTSRSERHCRQVETAIRSRWLHEARERGDENAVRQHEALFVQAWERDLSIAWDQRKAGVLMTMVGLSRQVPGAPALLWKWAPKLLAFPLTIIWDMLPGVVRGKVKRTVAAFAADRESRQAAITHPESSSAKNPSK